MKTITCVLAVVAAASTAAVAKELKQDQKGSVLAVSATRMSDAEMDKVTAGSAFEIEKCTQNGTNCQFVGAGGESFNRAQNNGYHNSTGNRGARFFQPLP